jgi:hypothetical protein
METGVDPARQARRPQTYSDPERPAAALGIATGGAFVMATMFGMFPFLMKLYADGGYQGPLFRRAVAKIMVLDECGDRQAFRLRKRICRPPEALGGRTYFRMARLLSQTGTGFRSDHRHRSCLGARRSHPHPHKTDRKSLRSITIIMRRTLI